ncbi:MAG TPA: heavy metal-responsive transcriptional regulator [Gemmatimonadaceae bacterium]|nr:heavy metal-responsive transcriptional regulator [Gemmatimonadaceae bacterium]
MRIGKASREAGVNVQTLRYYERRGLLPKTSRLASGYREYDSASVALVRFIKNAQELGFTLAEIGELIALRANRSQSDEDVRQLATGKIEEMDRRIRQLTEMKDELAALLERCSSTACKDNCVVIDALDDSNDQCRSSGTHSITGRHHHASH